MKNRSNWWHKRKITLKIVQARGTHTLTHVCAQPYHAGSRRTGQQFGVYWGSSAWTGKTCQLPRRVQSTHLSASSTQHMWELLAGNRTAVLPRHARQRRIMGCCMCAPCFKFAFWKWWIKLFYCINNLKSRLYTADFSKYWRSCFCPKLSKFHFP